ncbi:MAG TPA: glycosyltransferase [Gaiellaceae bacterium]
MAERGGPDPGRSVTVVIPALNEAAVLPGLLDTLGRQTHRPERVIVADAGSTDRTRELAAAHGAEVVDGGMPGVGRNAGAALATSDLLLFLDADVAMGDGVVAAMLKEFDKRDLVVAAAHIRPIERDARYVFACEVTNFYLDMMQYVAPHAPGCCILVRREVHEAIGGFDETLKLAEDHDYVERAAALGRFRILRRARVRVSMRRLASEGIVSLAFKYLYCEMQVMTGQKILDTPFDYTFAEFGIVEHVEPRTAVATLQTRLASAFEALQRVSSEGRDALRELGDTPIDAQLLERGLDRLMTDDLASLERYVRARERLARRGSRRALARIRAVAGSVWRELKR